MTDKYSELTNALIKAKEEAQKYINTENGGTCNFDSPAAGNSSILKEIRT